MKKFVAVFCLLLCVATLQAKDKPNPADFNIKIHISATHFRPTSPRFPELGNDTMTLYADAIINGVKIELAGAPITIEKSFSLIRPGDYLAKQIKNIHNQDESAFFKNYEILLSDGSVWSASTCGISE